MANTIIHIGDNISTKQSINNEIFVDVSMISKETSKAQYELNYDCLIDVGSNNSTQYLLGTDDEYVEITWKQSKVSTTYDPEASTFLAISPWRFLIDKHINLAAIFNSLHNIFHWIPGERILNPEFGSKLYYLLYNGITSFTVEQIVAEIKNCVSIWEPRVNIVDVINSSTINDIENNTVRLDIIFTVPSLDDQKYIYQYIQNKSGE